MFGFGKEINIVDEKYLRLLIVMEVSIWPGKCFSTRPCSSVMVPVSSCFGVVPAWGLEGMPPCGA